MQEVANQAGAAISGLTSFTDGGFREALILDTSLVPALVAYLDGSASHVQYHAAAALIALAGVTEGDCRQQVCGSGKRGQIFILRGGAEEQACPEPQC